MFARYRSIYTIFSLMILPPPRSTLFPTRRSSDLLHFRRLLVRGQRSLPLLRPGGDPGPGRGDAAQRLLEVRRAVVALGRLDQTDRKSTRLNSIHVSISYAVFCLKKKKSKLHSGFQ